MPFKLPSRYPPELPMIIASRLANALNDKLPPEAFLFGSGFPHEIWTEIASNKSSENPGEENSEIGFHVISLCNKSTMLAYHPGVLDEESDIHEGLSLALHIFSILGFRIVTICDGVNAISTNNPPIFAINDHVNLTGINPLDYWMKHTDPVPFFLDVKDLYLSESSGNKRNIHLATPKVSSFNSLIEAEKVGAISYGPAFCPETILAGYLGMKVRAIAVSVESRITSVQFIDAINSIQN